MEVKMEFYFVDEHWCEPLMTHVEVFWTLPKECHRNAHLFRLTLPWNTLFYRRRLLFLGRSPALESKKCCDCQNVMQVEGLCVYHNLCIFISWQLCCPVEEKLRNSWNLFFIIIFPREWSKSSCHLLAQYPSMPFVLWDFPRDKNVERRLHSFRAPVLCRRPAP